MFILRRLAGKGRSDTKPTHHVRIPDDVERLIFEKAVEDDRQLALQIVQVARRTQAW